MRWLFDGFMNDQLHALLTGWVALDQVTLSNDVKGTSPETGAVIEHALPSILPDNGRHWNAGSPIGKRVM